jgi:3-hydroxypropanoate dehydrogenase
MRERLNDASFDLVFRQARSHNAWLPKPVAPELLEQLYGLLKMGPTSANSCPARFIFVTSPEGKEKLKPALSSGNLAKTISAPVTAIIGYDTKFYELFPELFPHDKTAPNWFEGNAALIQETAFRNGTLQAAYLMIAARALGLDCGPMSGFDQAKVNAAFWPDGRIKVNFLCNIGYGDDAKIFARNPRLPFEKACQIV